MRAKYSHLHKTKEVSVISESFDDGASSKIQRELTGLNEVWISKKVDVATTITASSPSVQLTKPKRIG